MTEGMKGAPKFLVVDDDPAIASGIRRWLESYEYAAETCNSAEEAVGRMELEPPDAIISDITMPGMDGYELCRKVRERFPNRLIPFILVTGNHPAEERILGLEAGADDFLTKPLSKGELFARIRSLLRIKEMHDTIQRQASQLEVLNRDLEARIGVQIEQIAQLKRFFSPQIANLLTSGMSEGALRSHRREVTVVFIDLRGFTAFAETAEPEEVIVLLNEYYSVIGNAALRHGGTLGHYAGDGIMVFFNDPIEVGDHAGQALQMVLEVRDTLGGVKKHWVEKGYELDFGAGISSGFANIGILGFEGVWDYTVIGTVVNLAARLCAEAKGGQILVSQRFLTSIEKIQNAAFLGSLKLKGLSRPISVFAIEKPAVGAQGARADGTPAAEPSAKDGAPRKRRAA